MRKPSPAGQPNGSLADSTGSLLVIIGASLALIMTRHDPRPRRWLRLGSVSLASAGLAFGVVSRSGGQAPATRDVFSLLTITMLVAALLCAVAGAAAATRDQGPARRQRDRCPVSGQTMLSSGRAPLVANRAASSGDTSTTGATRR